MNYSELNQDFDCCDECEKCSEIVHECGAPLCDNCDPEKNFISSDVDCNIPFNK